MSKEIVLEGNGIQPGGLSFPATVEHILSQGHAIHGYSSAGSARLLMVLATKEYADDAPLLGFGMDGSAERALARALVTYTLREEAGLESITEKQFAESTEGQMYFGRNVSRFDNIVWGADFCLYRDGESAVATSNYGGGWGMEALMVEDETALGAVLKLTENYHFMNSRVKNFPPISLA